MEKPDSHTGQGPEAKPADEPAVDGGIEALPRLWDTQQVLTPQELRELQQDLSELSKQHWR